MKFLVIYESNGITGSVECNFRHNPPTIKDVRDAETEIRERHNFKEVIIMNWLPLSEG